MKGGLGALPTGLGALSGRRGRSCVISHVNIGRVGTLAYNSFIWHSISFFYSL